MLFICFLFECFSNGFSDSIQNFLLSRKRWWIWFLRTRYSINFKCFRIHCVTCWPNNVRIQWFTYFMIHIFWGWSNIKWAYCSFAYTSLNNSISNFLSDSVFSASSFCFYTFFFDQNSNFHPFYNLTRTLIIVWRQCKIYFSHKFVAFNFFLIFD